MLEKRPQQETEVLFLLLNPIWLHFDVGFSSIFIQKKVKQEVEGKFLTCIVYFRCHCTSVCTFWEINYYKKQKSVFLCQIMMCNSRFSHLTNFINQFIKTNFNLNRDISLLLTCIVYFRWHCTSVCEISCQNFNFSCIFTDSCCWRL